MGRAKQQAADAPKGDAQDAADADQVAVGGDAGAGDGEPVDGADGSASDDEQAGAGGDASDGNPPDVETDEGGVLLIKSLARNGHRRAGIAFSRKALPVPRSWLSDEEFAAIKADPRLVIVPAE